MADVNFEIGAPTVLGPLLASFGVLVAVRVRQGRPGWTGGHAVTRLLAAGYAAGVLALTLFPIVVTYGKYANQMPWTNQINWIPVPSPDPSIVANVILTVPLGMLLPLMSARAGSKGRVTALTAVVSLSIELTQLLMYIVCNNARLTDVTDLVVNTLGGLIGYVVLHRAARVPALARLLHTLALPGSAFATRGPVAPRPADATAANS
ncbi:VanZ family protein [Streptomyces panaciradicis]|uniref:VanZ family protein n=1 Tax=Streptomyces panaciradicis TaxID=1470261 RepID=UPI00201CFED8|nr:VanZ family protein [Streptomyces panaciradicis]MCL6667473.1 VanZ family protein [Streptomyces panaciradicis]